MKQVKSETGMVDKLDDGFAVVELDDVCLVLLIDAIVLDIGFSVDDLAIVRLVVPIDDFVLNVWVGIGEIFVDTFDELDVSFTVVELDTVCLVLLTVGILDNGLAVDELDIVCLLPVDELNIEVIVDVLIVLEVFEDIAEFKNSVQTIYVTIFIVFELQL